MTDLVKLQRLNDQRWATAKVTGRLSVDDLARKAVSAKLRYLSIVKRLRDLGSNIPDDAWSFIAVIHNRESGMNFNTHLGQGDPLTNKAGTPIKTVHVPAGRGPFTGPNAFEDAAVDALWVCAPYAAKANKDWSISGQLTYLERYNGLAYANAGRPSPYLWSGTTIYDPPTGPGGKVQVDHGPIANVVDKQLGVAALMLAIFKLDSATIPIEAPETPSLQPSLPEPGKIPVNGVYDSVWVQWAMNRLWTTPQLVVDGIIGAASRTAIRAFQATHHLRTDGIAGTNETIPAIKAELTKLNIPLFPVAAAT